MLFVMGKIMGKIVFFLSFSTAILLASFSAQADSSLRSSWESLLKAELQPYKKASDIPLKTHLQNGRVKVVIFWASWCSFCKDELQKMAQFQKGLSENQLNLVAVNVDTGFDLGVEVAKNYQDQMVMVHDKGAALKNKLGVLKLPMTLIYSETGEYITAYSGFNGERFSYIRKRINAQLKNDGGEI